MKNFKIISLGIAMLISVVAFAQDKTITGVVSDASGPLPGVNVVIKGTQRGVSTKFDGTYSITAKEGQTLEEVEKLMVDQIELVKKGEFPDWLLKAVITDFKLRKTKELESNASRADMMMNAFVNDLKWQESVDQIDRLFDNGRPTPYEQPDQKQNKDDEYEIDR